MLINDDYKVLGTTLDIWCRVLGFVIPEVYWVLLVFMTESLLQTEVCEGTPHWNEINLILES